MKMLSYLAIIIGTILAVAAGAFAGFWVAPDEYGKLGATLGALVTLPLCVRALLSDGK